MNNNTQEQIKNKNRLYYLKNKERILANVKERYQLKKDSIKSYVKEWCERNPERKRAGDTACRIRNKERYTKLSREYAAKRRKDADGLFKLKENMRSRFYQVFKNSYRKTSGATELLGCTIAEARKHLEQQWQPGMSWENYGNSGWHVDHIKPVNTFDLSDPEQLKQCFHYTNLRPLWRSENLRRPHDGSDILHSGNSPKALAAI